MSDVYVVGSGMTPFGKFPDKSVKDFTRQAVQQALDDAGCAVADIEAAWFSNTTQRVMEGQYLIPGQIALGAMGFEEIPVINVENACAGAGTAFFEARNYLKAGIADVVLAVGAEKMYSSDRASMFRIFDGAWDVHRADELYADLIALGEGLEPPDAQDGGQRSLFGRSTILVCLAQKLRGVSRQTPPRCRLDYRISVKRRGLPRASTFT